jgi:hypothetical protein
LSKQYIAKIFAGASYNKGFGKVGFGNKPSAFVFLLSFCTLALLKKRYGQGQAEGILFSNLPKAPNVSGQAVGTSSNHETK